ncbi:MAG: hypothetical protein ACYDAE_18885 [Steroidobacteraceae bacterium]
MSASVLGPPSSPAVARSSFDRHLPMSGKYVQRAYAFRPESDLELP